MCAEVKMMNYLFGYLGFSDIVKASIHHGIFCSDNVDLGRLQSASDIIVKINEDL